MEKIFALLICMALLCSCSEKEKEVPACPAPIEPGTPITAPAEPAPPTESPIEAAAIDYSKLAVIEPHFHGEHYLSTEGEVYSSFVGEEPVLVTLDEAIERIVSDPNSDTIYAFGKEGNIYAWGENSFRSIYGRDEAYLKEPVKIDFPFKVTELRHSYKLLTVMDENGQLYGCGDINSDFNEDPTQQYPVENKELTLLWDGSKGKVADFRNGEFCRTVLTENGEVYVQGVLAMENNFPFYEDFTKVDFPETIVKARPVPWGLICLSDSGKLYYIGIDGFAFVKERDPDAPADSYYEVVKIPKLEGQIMDFEASVSIVARTKDSKFYIWGYNSSDFIKAGEAEYINEPLALELPENTVFYRRGVYSGSAITDKGEAYIYNKDGVKLLK